MVAGDDGWTLACSGIDDGLDAGGIYAMVALGFTMIYSASGVVNFAQGEFVMLGGMVASALIAAGVPMPLAFLLAIVVAVIFGIALYRIGVEPLKRADPVVIIMMTIGASITIRGIVQIVFDRQFHSMPTLSGDTAINVLGVAIQPQTLWVIGAAVLIVASLFAFLDRSLAGKALRATSINLLAAQLVGIDTRRMVSMSFVISAAIGAIAGILITPITLVSYDTGPLLAVKGFAAAILGGIGFPPGAIAGGLLLGLIEALSAGYISSAYKDAFAFIAMLIILLCAPNGIFKRGIQDRV